MFKGTELLPNSCGDATASNTKRTVERGVKFGKYTTALLTGKAHEMLLFDGRMIHDSILPTNQEFNSKWQRHLFFIAATNHKKVTVGTF